METLVIHPTKEQEKAVISFLDALQVPFEKKPAYFPVMWLQVSKKTSKTFQKEK